MGVKAIDAVSPMIALKGAFAANHFGLFVVGVITAILPLKNYVLVRPCFRKAKRSRTPFSRSSLLSLKKQKVQSLLSKAYIELADKQTS